MKLPSRLPRLLAIATLVVAVAALVAAPASAQGEPQPRLERAVVHFLLEPLVEEPVFEIPEILQTELGGLQGRHFIEDRPALSLHLRTDASPDVLASLGARVRSWGEGRATIDILPEYLPELVHRHDVYSISLPRKLKRILETSVPNTGADHLRSESGGVFSGDTGAGVIVGVVDSGIDLDHPNFQDPFGNTRILYVLDQNTGIECTAAQIDANTCAQTDDGSGHGTHVTGIAAGNGAAVNANGNVYESAGVAPGADIIVVKTTFMSDDIEDAITYIFDKADALDQPAVINLSLGTHLGAHDGTDSMEEHIDDMVTAENGRAVVIAAGNERLDEIHAELKTQAMVSVIGPDFEIDPYTANFGVGNDIAIIAGYYPDSDDLIAHLWTPTGDYLTQPLNTTGVATCAQADTASGFIWLCNNTVSILGQGTTDNEIVIAIFDQNQNTGAASAPPGVGTWGTGFSGMTVVGPGEADFWAVGSMGPRFTTMVDEEETLGMPATAQHGITVGAHTTKVCWEDASSNTWSYWFDFGLNALESDIAWFSSWGPTRDGRQKPELVAPGAAIVSARASTAALPSYFNVNSDYLMMQGTSQAAPHVAGAAALLFEDDPNLSAADIRTALTSNTSQSYFSGYTGPGPGWNPVFGAGLLDLSFLGTDPWETNDRVHYAREVLSGEAIDGFIGDPADEDHYRVAHMIAGDTLTATLDGLPADYDLELQAIWSIGIACHNSGPVPNVEASSNNPGTTPESATASAGPWWFADHVRIFSAAGGFDASNPYALEAVVTRPETTSTHNTKGSAQVLPEFVKFNVAGDTSVLGEADYYRFPVAAGETISASIVSGTAAHDVQILPATGAFVLTPYGDSVSTTVGTAGNYYVRVRRQTSGATASYTLHLDVD